MSITTTYAFSNQANFVISNSAYIEVNSGNAQLKLAVNSQNFNQIFPNSEGFSFVNSYTQVQSSQLRQIDQIPTNATAGATYTTDANFNWGAGTLVSSLTGGSVAGGRLNLKGATVKYCDYSADQNADHAQTGCFRFNYIPNYSGTPATYQFLMNVNPGGVSQADWIQINHTPGTGSIDLYIYNSAGASIVTAFLGAWSPVAGTSYEFELNYDITTGATRLFIDGVQHGATQTGTGTRSANSTRLRIGSHIDGSYTANFELDNLIIFSTVQHTANYTPSGYVPENKYTHDTVTHPTFVSSWTNPILGFTGFSAVTSQSPRHTVTHQGSEKYWDGSSWNFSVGSYSQANCYQIINTKINSLMAVNTLGIKTYFTDTNSFSANVSSLQLSYTVNLYPGSGSEQTITPATAVNAEELLTIITSHTITGSDHIKMNIIDNGVEKYFNVGSDAWLTATSGYATATNLSDITSANNSKLLNLGSAIKWKAYLHGDNFQSTPLLTGLSLMTDFFAGSVSTPDKIIVYGRAFDDLGQPIQNVTVRAQLTQVAVYNNEIYIGTNSASTTTNSDGYWDLNLVHTDSLQPATQYRITQQHCNLNQTNIVYLPNSGQYNLTSVRSL